MECGRSSLANLLLELNDPRAAQAVYDNFRKHEFVDNRGTTTMLLLPRILRNITEGVYSGIMYCHLEQLNLEQELERWYGNQWEDALNIIREDQALGTIQEAPERLLQSLPAIIVIKPKYFTWKNGEKINYSGKINHAVVIKNPQKMIDDGFEVNYEISDLKVVAVFEAKKA